MSRRTAVSGLGCVTVSGDGRVAFGDSLSHLTPNTTRAFLVHFGRCADIAERFAPVQECEWMEQIKTMLAETTASFMVEHSDQVFHVAARINGIPDVGDLVTQMLNEQMAWEESRGRLSHAKKSGKWNEALAVADEMLPALRFPTLPWPRSGLSTPTSGPHPP